MEKYSVDQKKLRIIGIIFLFLIAISVLADYLINNSDEYITRKYLEFNNYHFEGEVINKSQDQAGSGANIARYVHLNSGVSHRVPINIYQELKIGDYVMKKINSDTVFYILKYQNDTVKRMENSYFEAYNKIDR